MSELKPCPFCGKEASFIFDDEVMCDNCGAILGSEEQIEELLKPCFKDVRNGEWRELNYECVKNAIRQALRSRKGVCKS